jgi:hypothetical protein
LLTQRKEAKTTGRLETGTFIVAKAKRGPKDLTKKTLPQLQHTLWPIFAEYIKRNYAIDGWCECFTCQKKLQLGNQNLNAGHFLSRSYSPTKYDTRNVRPQCGSPCNKYGGKPVEFERNLRLEIGDDHVEELKTLSTTPWKWNHGDLIEQILYYRAELKEMR